MIYRRNMFVYFARKSSDWYCIDND